jgi:hypothetical protein
MMQPTIAPARAPLLTLFGNGWGRLVWLVAVLDAVELAIVLLELREMLEDVTGVIGDEADREPGADVLVNTASELDEDVAAALVKVVVFGSGPGRGEDDVVLDEAAAGGVV